MSRQDSSSYENGCRGKRRLTSRRMADGYLRVIARRYASEGQNPDRLESYKCRACGGWHLGNGNTRHTVEEP